jgi:hypothetical protein
MSVRPVHDGPHFSDRPGAFLWEGSGADCGVIDLRIARLARREFEIRERARRLEMDPAGIDEARVLFRRADRLARARLRAAARSSFVESRGWRKGTVETPGTNPLDESP